MIRAAVLVPRRDNNGRRITRALRDDLERRLVALAGGASLTRHIHGMWQAAGRLYRDENDRYELWLDSWLILPAWLEVVRWVQEVFEEAMGIEVAGIPEVVTFR